MNRVDFSVVSPAYNEVGSVSALFQEIRTTLDGRSASFEVIFVDDGSTDGTTEEIKSLAENDPCAVHLRLPRNSGKSAAYMAGFSVARGAGVITLDADGQDDIAEIGKLLEKNAEGYDLVVGRKEGRFRNEPCKAFPSWVFNCLVHWLFGLRLYDSNSGYRLMTRDVAKSLELYGGFYRFIPVLAHLHGFDVTEVSVRHRKRSRGVTKYGPQRFWLGLLDLLAVRFVTAFMDRPLHLYGTIAILLLASGVGLHVYVLIQKLMGSPFAFHLAALVIGTMMILMSVQVLTTGLIGVMIAARVDRRGLPEFDGARRLPTSLPPEKPV